MTGNHIQPPFTATNTTSASLSSADNHNNNDGNHNADVSLNMDNINNTDGDSTPQTTKQREENELQRPRRGFRSGGGYSSVLTRLFRSAKNATYAWVGYTLVYWSILVLLPCVLYNNLNTYQYYLWLCGMIGVMCVYYAVKADQSADSPAGKPLMALTCLLMATDWLMHAYFLLYDPAQVTFFDYLLMLFHAFAILWSSLFFYNRAFKHGKKLALFTLIVEWLDIVFMCCVILVLNNYVLTQHCLSRPICIGYFVMLCVQIFVWLFPIMFGYSNTELYIHIHMVILDCLTDLPLLVVIVLDDGYNIHWFLYFDILWKLLLLLRTLSFHLIFNLCCRYKRLKLQMEQNEAEYELELRLFDEGAQETEIDRQLDSMINKHKTILQQEVAHWSQH